MTKYLRRKILKFFVYAVIVFASYVIQSTPGLFEFQGVSPMLVLPACICLAVYEGEFAGGLFGFFAGLFLSVRRVLRCNPFCRAGYDPVPPKPERRKRQR